MTFQLRPATRSEAKPLIGLYSESGRGKTYSALLLARGYAGPQGRICMIETESGRGEAYSDMIEGGYDVISLRETFAPAAYGEAIAAAEKAKVDALIIDSASHEWEGAGGVLAMAAGNQANGRKGPIVWQQPKMDHQRHFMLRLMQTPIPLVIVCMRAKYPMKEVQQPNGRKEWVRADDLEPIQAADILYEMFVHGWIDTGHRFRATKYTRPDLAEIIRDGEPISLETGQRLAAWAKGADKPTPAEQPAEAPAETRKASAAEFWRRDDLTIPVRQNDGKPAWQEWDNRMRRAIDSAPDADALDLLYSDNAGSFDAYEAANKRGCDLLRQHVEFTKKRLTDMAGDEQPEQMEAFS